MDMSQFNESIKNAEENPSFDGPKFPDGNYIMAVTTHEDKPKHEIPDTNPKQYEQFGLWVTMVICEGEYKGKEYRKYFGLKHPTAEYLVKSGHSDLKKLYKVTINAIPMNFTAVYGKRFMVRLEEEKDKESDFPYPPITKWGKAPEIQMESFDESAPASPPPTNPSSAGSADAKWNSNDEITEIPF